LRPRRLAAPAATLVAALLLAAPPACRRAAETTDPGAPRAVVTIRDERVEVEIADTRERQRRGLSGRAELAEGEGMLFPYARADRYAFWMPDMHFDIDIVWIREGAIVDVTHRARHDPPPGPPPLYRPRVPADLVLEVPAGTAARLGWSPGDAVRVQPPLAAPLGP
jgi:uncharacterized membrane protein (UPF0127 family)